MNVVSLQNQGRKRFFPFKLSSHDPAKALQLMRPDRKVTLLQAAEDPKPIDQQLADAFNANNAVMAYVIGLQNSNLPVLTPAPDWYNAFVKQFSDAKVHAMSWQNTVTPGLVAIPTGIVNYALVWSLNMETIDQSVEILLKDPNNQLAAQAVRNSLQQLLQGVSGHLATATSFQQTIDTFAQQLTADAAIMQAAIKSAESTIGYDQAQVQKLVNDIHSLQDQLATWQAVLPAAGIGAGVGFFAGAVIAIFSFGAGLAFGIISVVVGIALIIAASVEIQQLSAQIKADQAKMSDLNQQIASLKMLEQNLSTLIKLSSAASEQVELIIQAWQVMEQELTKVITDLNNAQGDLAAKKISQLQKDLHDANTDWQTLKSFASTMAGISYNQATPATAQLQTTAQLAAVA